MSVTSIQELPVEILESIFNYLEPKNVQSASQVCKSWNKIVNSKEILFHSLCTEFSKGSTPIDQSWKKRWQVMADYNPEYCQRYVFSLQTFFDQDLKFISPLSFSCFNDEVILTNSTATCLYRCNYMTGQQFELPIIFSKVDDKIEQIYCTHSCLAVRSTNSIFVYDLKTNKKLNQFFYPTKGFITFYDGCYLIVERQDDHSIESEIFIFNSLSLPAQMVPIVANFMGNPATTFPPSTFFDGKSFVKVENYSFISSHTVFNLDTEKIHKLLPINEHIGKRATQTIINAHLLAYSIIAKVGPQKFGTSFNLVKYNQPSNAPAVSSFVLSEQYETSCSKASKQHLVSCQKLQGTNRKEIPLS